VRNGVSYYRKPSGYYQADFRKYGTRYMHRDIWEHYNGPVPLGHHIHHKNHDRGDNRLENLELVEARHHGHRHLKDQHYRGVRGPMTDAVRTAAAKWHKSEEGRAWHKEHAKRIWEGRPLQTRTCSWCGKSYQGRGSVKKGFCGMSCQGMARKASGVDDETRACSICGSHFTTDKYGKRHTCSQPCAVAAMLDKRRSNR
jgi:hypothetical protein